jgi:radical SAM protein with 4Fe4S-binding SPASM domain
MNDVEQQFKRYFKDRGSFPFPQRITVELTNRCNLNCPMCPRHLLSANLGDMEWSLYKKIIDEASAYLPVALVPFFRGETLLQPHFLKMLKYAKDKGLGPIQLATNAVLLKEDIAKEILRLELDFISFSLNSIDFSINRDEAKRDPYKVGEKVEKFISLKNKLHLKNPTIQVSLVETENTKEVVKRFVNEWVEKVDRVRVYKEHSKNGQFGSLDAKESKEQPRKPCLKVLTDMVIYWDGQVALCNHDWFRRDKIGHTGDKSVKEIWQGNEYHHIRELHYQGRGDEDLSCQGCDHWITYYKPGKIIGELYSKEKQ